MSREASKDEAASLRDFARKRLKSQHDFKQFLMIWAFVAVLTTGVWFLTSPNSYYWPVWGIGGMGIAAFFMWVEAYGPGTKKIITEADVDAELERLKRKG